MAPSSFGPTPDPTDVLQVAGDAALDTIRMALTAQGFERDDYTVVMTLETDQRLATVLHLPGEEDDPKRQLALAFQTQMIHLRATAKELGIEVRLVPVPGGQG